MVTHATSSIAVCYKVLFLARGGRIAFYGPPEEALIFFGAKGYADIYQKVESRGTFCLVCSSDSIAVWHSAPQD